MSASFASQEWADSLLSHLRDDARVRTDAVTWVFGPVLLDVDADAERGTDATGVRLDVHEGDVSSASVVEGDQTARTPFVIGGSVDRWKAVFAGTLPIVDAVADGKLRFRGDLPTLTRHRSLFDGVARAGAALDTDWRDPKSDA